VRFLYLATKEEHGYISRCVVSIESLRQFHNDKVVVYAPLSLPFSHLHNVEVRPLPESLASLEELPFRYQVRWVLFREKSLLIQENEEVESTVWVDCDTVFVAPLDLTLLEEFVFFGVEERQHPSISNLVEKYEFTQEEVAHVYSPFVFHLPKKYSSRWDAIRELMGSLYLVDRYGTGQRLALNVCTHDLPKYITSDSVRHFGLVSPPPPRVLSFLNPISVGCSVVLTPIKKKFVGYSFLPMSIACCEHQTYTDFEVIVVAPPDLTSLPFDEAESILGRSIDRSRFSLVEYVDTSYSSESLHEMRNIGIEESRGAVISIWDVDGYYGPNYLQQSVALHQSEGRICGGFCKVYDIYNHTFMERGKLFCEELLSVTREWVEATRTCFHWRCNWEREFSIMKDLSTSSEERDVVRIRSVWEPSSRMREVDSDLTVLRRFVGDQYVDNFYSKLMGEINSKVSEESL